MKENKLKSIIDNEILINCKSDLEITRAWEAYIEKHMNFYFKAIGKEGKTIEILELLNLEKFELVNPNVHLPLRCEC